MNYSREINCSSRGIHSSGMKKNNINKGKDNKKYCGVCHKAGKTANEYESHFTKSLPGPAGVVTCPMILASVCKRCGNAGHFSDHCTLKQNLPFKNNRLSTALAPLATATATATAAAPLATAVGPLSRLSGNGFALLAVMDSDDDDVVMPVVKRPKISVEKEIASLAPNGVSFATILLKPVPVPVSVSVSVPGTALKLSPNLQRLLSSEQSERLLLAEKIFAERKRKPCSWADSDSDSDGDEEENSAW